MLAECPDCRRRLRWTYVMYMPSAQWPCEGCGSLLEIDGKRRLRTVALNVVSAVVIAYTQLRMGFGALAIIPVFFCLPLFLCLLFDRAIVLKRHGLRCKDCGYDLRGQVASRCPECGAAMDDTQRESLKTGRFDPIAVRPHRVFVVLLIILGLAMTLEIGYTLYQWLTYG